MTLSDNPVPKARRFSVHDVQPDDNVVTYGQPDNVAFDAPTRIASVHDGSDLDDAADIKKTKSMHSARSSGDDDDDGGDALIITETVDYNDQYAADQIAADSELFDAIHYRHPSLADTEHPIHDDFDEPKDHERYQSVIRHDVPDIGSLDTLCSLYLLIAILRNLSLFDVL